MVELTEELLRHKYIFVPWGGRSTVEDGKRVGLYVHSRLGGGLTVVCPYRKGVANHDELAKLPVVTQRSGQVPDGGVVLAFRPSHKVMEKVYGLDDSVVVLVEGPTWRFNGWARLVGAYNPVTGQLMESGLSAEGVQILDDIAEGYNGWDDSTSEQLTLGRLADLAAADGYDRELVLASARMNYTSVGAMMRLERILTRFEAGQAG